MENENPIRQPNEKPKVEDIEKALRKVGNEFFERITTSFVTALSVVVALAWNEAVKALLEKFFGVNNGLIAKFFYAVIITVVLVVLSLQFSKKEEK